MPEIYKLNVDIPSGSNEPGRQEDMYSSSLRKMFSKMIAEEAVETPAHMTLTRMDSDRNDIELVVFDEDAGWGIPDNVPFDDLAASGQDIGVFDDVLILQTNWETDKLVQRASAASEKKLREELEAKNAEIDDLHSKLDGKDAQIAQLQAYAMTYEQQLAERNREIESLRERIPYPEPETAVSSRDYLPIDMAGMTEVVEEVNAALNDAVLSDPDISAMYDDLRGDPNIEDAFWTAATDVIRAAETAADKAVPAAAEQVSRAIADASEPVGRAAAVPAQTIDRTSPVFSQAR